MFAVLVDLRQALRRLASTTWMSLAAVLTLTLGVGLATAAATVVRGVLLAPLAYPEAGRLVRIYQTLDHLRTSPNPRLAAIWNRLPLPYLRALELRESSRTLASVGLFLDTTAVLAGEDEPQDVPAARVQSELLAVLGVEPLLGRTFTSTEVQRGERLVVLGHGLWQRAFAGEREIIGRTVRLDGEPHAVIGIMPPGFNLPGRKDGLWLPLTPSDDDLTVPDNYFYAAIGRLAPGATLAAAQAELGRPLATSDRPATTAGSESSTDQETDALRLVPLLETVVGESRRFVALLAAAAAVVLLIACVNVAHLLLVQGADRRRELALRLALGASRPRLLRRLGIESLLLALLGGAGGLLLAAAVLRGLSGLAAEELPRLEKVGIDVGSALVALGASILAALAAGLLPALRASGVAPGEALAVGRHGGSPGRRLGAHDGLVIAEVALSLVLTACAVLLANSWQHLATVDAGYQSQGVLVQEVRLPAWRYPDPVRRQAFGRRLMADLEALPGVEAAALTSRLPVGGPVLVGGFRIPGQDAPGGDWTQGRSAALLFATPGYFRLLGIPLLSGRPFRAETGEQGRGEMVVNRLLAERHWPDGDAVGAEVVMGEEAFRVVGVMEDVRHLGPIDEPGELIIRPWSQGSPAALAALVAFDTGSPIDHAGALRAALRHIDPALPLPPAVSLQQVAAGELAGPRSRTLLAGSSAGVALLLTLVGTYGVMAYSTSRRRREIGIRMALGADAPRVQQLVLGRTLRLALVGVILGTAGAAAAGHLLQGLLYGVEVSTPLALAGAALLLTATCLAAGYLPARRASRLQPARTLRSE